VKQAWLVGALLLNLAIVVAAALVVVQHTREPVEAIQAPPAARPASILVSGSIIGDVVTIESSASARVSELHAQPGQVVEKSSLLLVLDDPQLTASLQKATVRKDAVSGSLADADSLLASLREEVPQQIWAAEQKVIDARTALAERQEDFDKASRSAWRLEKKARENMAASQVAEPAKLRAIIEKTAESEMLSAQLKTSRSKSALLEAQANLAMTEHDLARVEIRRQKVETLAANVQLQYQQAEHAAQSLLEQQAQLAELSLHSPEKGVIMTVLVKPGQDVVHGVPLLTLSSLAPLYLDARIPALETGDIAVGQDTDVRVDQWPDRRFKARVIEVSSRSGPAHGDPQVAPATINTVRLQILENPEGLLKPGMAAHAVLQQN
jgi:multidrug resistance efflux pump